MDRIAHDPKTKQQIKDSIYGFLYAPVIREFKARIDTLIERNTILGGYSHRHFLYKGTVYSAENTTPPLKKNRLMPQLKDEMDKYLKDQEILNGHELPFVLGFLNQVLNASNDLGDYKRLLPESVHVPLDTLMATCPCQNASLSDEKVEAMKARNAEPLKLIRQRQALNLLI